MLSDKEKKLIRWKPNEQTDYKLLESMIFPGIALRVIVASIDRQKSEAL